MNLDSKDQYYYAAIRRYTRLLKAFPGNTHVLALRASCRFWHADWRKAADDYEQLTKVESDNDYYWGMLGQACAHGRLPEKSITACTRAIELDRHNEIIDASIIRNGFLNCFIAFPAMRCALLTTA
ncbi:hypothetical protein AGMMS49579_26680 [Spirochaetia bacterium]|nr:hypothetical protein AGMMS49579_26680 [Spirochaetia bacterium]